MEIQIALQNGLDLISTFLERHAYTRYLQLGHDLGHIWQMICYVTTGSQGGFLYNIQCTCINKLILISKKTRPTFCFTNTPHPDVCKVKSDHKEFDCFLFAENMKPNQRLSDDWYCWRQAFILTHLVKSFLGHYTISNVSNITKL